MNMDRVSAFAALSILAILAAGTTAHAVPIGDLHQNDANGFPAAPFTVGTPVTVHGIVTVPDSVFNMYSSAVHVQDATGGIYLFQSGGGSVYDFDLGDSVTVSGEVGQFLGITEVTGFTAVTVHSSGHAVPEPLDLTCAEVAATFDPVTYREEHEGRLVRIRDVTIVGGTWPTSPGNGAELTIDDGTGTTTLFINQFTQLNGTPQPPVVFDVSGVIQQDDLNVPLDAEHRIVPRFLYDIIGDGPGIISGPEVVEINPTSARIEWTTSVPSNSTVELGPTTSYGLSFTEPAMVTDHSILCDPIDDATYWHYRVASNDGQGTTYSQDDVFITPPATDEAIMVYFNKSIDPSYAGSKVAAGNVPLDGFLVDYIAAAQYSLDAAMYSLTLSHIADAIIAAHQRGIQVRVIKEATTGDTQYNRLVAAGVPCIDSHFGGNHASGGVHHNKYWVRDAREMSTTLDDWVITGSWNPSYQGTEYDAQNIVVIKDAEVCEAYTIEFDEMWGSSTQVPDPVASRMGTEKYNNTGHNFDVNGVQVDVRFSPSDGSQNVMIYYIGDAADHQIYFSILHFNQEPIEQAMRVKWDNVPDFEVRGIFDDNIDNDSRYHNMSGAGTNPWSPPADVHLGDYSPGYFHHKSMIIDPGHADSNPIVITGSTNWTYAGGHTNDENQVYIFDYTIARIFLQEFAERYHTAGGTGELGMGSGSGIAEGGSVPGAGRAWLRNAPNPFNPYTQIEFNLPQIAQAPRLVIYDVAGRTVRELGLTGTLPAGQYRVTWDGTDAGGRAMPSGVYFYRLQAEGAVTVTNSMVLAR